MSLCCLTTLNPLNSVDETNTSKMAPQPPTDNQKFIHT